MSFRAQYTPRQIATARPFFGTGWPVRNPSGNSIVERSQYRRQRCVWIACTQLGPPYKTADQKRIIREWCAFFREDSPIRELALRSRVPPELFQAVCHQRQLTRLHVKWGPIVDLAPLQGLRELEGLSLGTTSVEDISAVAALPKLKYLQLDNLNRVSDFGALSSARRLEFLEIEGYWQGPKKSHLMNLDFAQGLRNLRALRIGYVAVRDCDVSPLLGLRKLEYLDLPSIAQRDRNRILAALPKLRFGNVVHLDRG
jgi:Leucine-rich repeat (LRR) protein